MKKLLLAFLVIGILGAAFVAWLGPSRTLAQGLTYRLEAGRGIFPNDDAIPSWGIAIFAVKINHEFADAPTQNWWRLSAQALIRYGESEIVAWLQFYRYHKGW